MNPLVVALAVAVVFGLLITLHEMGHLLMAKAMGVKVLEFNVGFGPPLLRWGGGETRYGLRVVPLGGYVRLAGMDDGDDSPRSFNAKPVWRRFLIIAAGSLTNLALPLVLFFCAGLLFIGGPVRAVAFTAGSPANAAGIPLNAEIVSIDGHRVETSYGMRQLILNSGGRPLRLEYRDPDTKGVDSRLLTPQQVDGHWRLGIGPEGGGFDPVGSVDDTLNSYGDMVKGVFLGFASLASGRIPGGLIGPCGPSGPVGIVRATAVAASAGLGSLMRFAAFLSLNLGILNLMPIPALDGGRLFFIVLEGIRRKPINPIQEQRVHYGGLVVLLSLVALISINDVSRLGTSFTDLVTGCSG